MRDIRVAQEKRWPKRTIAERIEHHSVPELTSGCWIWTGAVNKSGRPSICIDNVPQTAARVAYATYKGESPGRLCVCHHCDTPLCVNPEHLFLGTIGDNNADRHRKGRSNAPKGEANGISKLTEAQAESIRNDRRTAREIAAEYGIGQTVVGYIQRGKAWRHVGGQTRSKIRSGMAKLTDDQIKAIRADPRRQSDIAKDYNTTQTNISQIKRRTTWRHIP